jgi:chromosome partitioning protein
MQTAPVIALVNQKGGVGKTSIALGVASAARAVGKRVLVIDIDPQANSTTALGIDGDGYDANDVLYANSSGAVTEAIRETSWGELVKCVPATLALADRELDPALGIEFRLRKALDGVEDVDLVLIDCPPSVGRLVTNALVAASHALVVTEPSAPALQGVQNLLDTISVVQEHYNRGLEVAGVIINRVPARSREAHLRVAEVAQVLGAAVWEPYVPARTVVAEALGAQAPIHDFGSRAADLVAVYEAFTTRLLALDNRKAPAHATTLR